MERKSWRWCGVRVGLPGARRDTPDVDGGLVREWSTCEFSPQNLSVGGLNSSFSDVNSGLKSYMIGR